MNIAIFTKNWLGDVIFQSPAIETIKSNFPTAKLIAITPRRCETILKAHPAIDEVIGFDDRDQDKNLLSKLRLIFKLRSLKIERVYLFHRSWSRALIAFLSGAHYRVGFNTKNRGFLLTSAIPEPASALHSVEYFLYLLRNSGLSTREDFQYSFYFSENDLKKAKTLFRENGLEAGQVIAINPGANWLPKRWPVGHFQELARRLVEKYKVKIVITGAEADQKLAGQILNSIDHSSVVSLCGKTNITELGALFSLCRLLISNDSGPLHIGAGVGINVIGIFGPTDPKLTGPLGKGKNIVIHYVPEGQKVPWYGQDFPYGTWMEHITVDQILETIEREHLIDNK